MADAPQMSPEMEMANIGGGIGGSLGGLLGFFGGSGDRQQATDALGNATQNFNNLSPQVRAHLAAISNQGQSAYNGIQMDPATRDAQMAALGQLKNIYQSGGLDAQARADIATQQAGANQNAQALNSQINNNMAQRGLANSGARFAAQRAGAATAANNANLAGMQALAGGQNRADAAATNAGALAGGIRGQDYGIASDRAGANDAISRFNAQNQTQNNQFNANQGQTADQWTFQNSLARAQGQQSGLDNQAKNWSGQADKWQDMGAGVGKNVGAAAGYAAGGV